MPPAADPSPAPEPRTGPATSPSPRASPPAPLAEPDVSFVSAAQLGSSWRPGCPIGPDQLRMLTVVHVGFDGADHTGKLIVHVDAVTALRTAFARLYAARFPIRKMVPIDAYGASDAASLADDNTAAFNCRLAVNPGAPPSWSEHAYGRAIDVNPVENPYIYSNGTVDPAAGQEFLVRTNHRPGMAYPGSPLNDAFAAVGWRWGGVWTSNPDYQHFSASGN